MDAITAEIAFMATSAGKAFVILMDPVRLMYLSAGCIMGLILGIVPGIGGLAGTAMLLPFTFNMDPYTAFALLLGLGSTTATGDPIPAILFGVPGGAASAATVLDGFPMAKKGEAGRALSAAYMSSLMGGVFGAFLMAVSIPILRPVMLFLGSPELLAFSVLGISMVAILSGNAPLRGMTAGCFGHLIAMIGTDPQSGTLRWTFNSLYLWDGLPLTPLLLGVFALPELCDLLISRTAISADTSVKNIYKGQLQGMADCFKHWWLIMRCSWIGGGIGSIPGISASVVDWLAYGHALKTEKGANLTFGKGDVRGVIASESANNAKEGGALVPTVAFGVPGSATMAILLGAFLIHGLVPGPDMLTKNLDITYAMVWSVALANILGAGMCYAFSPQFARLSVLRFSLILPAVLGIIYIGGFEATRQWGDLYSLLAFGLLGWIMKQFKWPRPPLILGVVLGDTIERYLFISVERYGISWFARPVVAILFLIAIIGLVRPFLQDIRIHGGLRKMMTSFQAPRFHVAQLFTIFMIALIGSMVLMALSWDFSAKIVPLVVGTVALTAAGFSLFNDMCRKPEKGVGSLVEQAMEDVEQRINAAPDGSTANPAAVADQKIHMDLTSDTAHLPVSLIIKRAARFFGYLLAFMGVMSVIGLIPTIAIFVVVFMRYENQERWSLIIPYAVVLLVSISFVFDYVMSIPWPPTFLGQWFPYLKFIPSV
ncbi:MAG: putative tricarboxylic transport rane protein [Alphaproteobacteria bacterium]|nr:putative tricarboxylic transport rane protein [Alphaproteobacteria bacterium]